MPRAGSSAWSLALLAVLMVVTGGGCRWPRGREAARAGPPLPPGGEQAGRVLEKVAPAIVRVDVTLRLLSGSHQRRGSGFMVSQDGLAITAASVIRAAVESGNGGEQTALSRTIEVTTTPGAEDEAVWTAQVVRENSQLDLAVLQLDKPPGGYLTFAAGEVAAGATLFACSGGSLVGPVAVRAARVTQVGAGERGDMLELSVPPDPNSCGGPVVDADGHVVGVQRAGDTTGQTALVAAAVSRWLASRPESDESSPSPGETIAQLLRNSGLDYTDRGDGIFEVPFDNGVQVLVHQNDTYLRAFVSLGAFDPATGLKALAFNYYDPLGKLSVYTRDNENLIAWEAQVPLASASADYLKLLVRVGASQVARWRNFVRGTEPDDWYDMYPGGDDDTMRAKLERAIQATVGTYYGTEGDVFTVDREDVTIYMSVFQGMAWIHRYTGGMPGDDQQGQLVVAEDLLRRNWHDPLGRFSVDEYNDLGWEVQAPVDMLKPEFIDEAMTIGAAQVKSIWNKYGEVPFNQTDDE
ncbi:MAG: serine protease [Armatimonadetes bacterium]|nr:serine protease [Armatimonadota bacterium]